MEKKSLWPRRDVDSPPTKQAKRLESAVVTRKSQISSLTAQDQKMMAGLLASGIDVPDSDPSLGEEEEEDRKMAANKKNFNFTKTNKRKK